MEEGERMAKLIMMKGLPASGKTTKAKEMLEEYGNFVRVNRDQLRPMLHGDARWSGKKEKLTVLTERILVANLLAADNSVIVDDTNLFQSHRDMWSNIAINSGAKFEVYDMDADYETCVERDLARDNSVGIHVIGSMALKAGLIGRGEFILCDIDGTIADLSHRLYHIRNEEGTKNWDAFFSGVYGDKFRADVWDQVLDAVTPDHMIVFLSGRSDVAREATEKWIGDHTGITCPLVLMRQAWDHRPDTELKSKMYDDHFGYPGHKVIKVFDDRPRVINMWKDKGLDVVDVGPGVDF